VITYALHGRPADGLVHERLFVNLRDQVRSRAYSKLPKISDFQRLKFNHPDGNVMDGEDFESWLSDKDIDLPGDFPERFYKRDKYLVWTPQVLVGNKTADELRALLSGRIDKRGGDPYLGQPLAFDYIFCRLGATPYERDVSLVLDLSVLEFSDLAKYHQKVWESSPLQYTDISDIDDVPTYNMYLKENDLQLMKNVLRIYAYCADVIVYKDGIIYS
jgi:hypothetical protein